MRNSLIPLFAVLTSVLGDIPEPFDFHDDTDAIDEPDVVGHRHALVVADLVETTIRDVGVVGARSVSALTAWAISNQFELFFALIETFLSLKYMKEYSFFAVGSPGPIPAVVSLSVVWARALTCPRRPPTSVAVALAYAISAVVDISGTAFVAHAMELWMITFLAIGTNEFPPVTTWLGLGISWRRIAVECLFFLFGGEIIGAPAALQPIPPAVPRAFNTVLAKTFRTV